MSYSHTISGGGGLSGAVRMDTRERIASSTNDAKFQRFAFRGIHPERCSELGILWKQQRPHRFRDCLTAEAVRRSCQSAVRLQPAASELQQCCSACRNAGYEPGIRFGLLSILQATRTVIYNPMLGCGPKILVHDTRSSAKNSVNRVLWKKNYKSRTSYPILRRSRGSSAVGGGNFWCRFSLAGCWSGERVG